MTLRMAKASPFTFSDDRRQARIEECRRDAHADGLPARMTMPMVADFAHYATANAAYCWLRKNAVQLEKRGKVAVVESWRVVYQLRYGSTDLAIARAQEGRR